jgi:hypothetical protein
VVLDEGVALPEGTPVQVEPLAPSEAPPANASADFAQFLDELEAEAGLFEGPADFAAEHDHYLYGAPKRHGADAK